MPDALREQEPINLADYLRETIAEMDRAIRDLREKRTGLAIRLAAIEAATSPEIAAVAADFDQRLTENRPYESAEDAESLIAEASRRFSP